MSVYNCHGFKLCNIFVRHSKRSVCSNIEISDTVKAALAKNKPVVALESTIITHGMPYPHNKNTTELVETIIRQHGATPATIGVIEGKIKVGLDENMLERLSHPDTQTVKISRRDFPYVLSQGLNGGTTVSGTLLVAEKAGIDVFVTGYFDSNGWTVPSYLI